jgi:hypothetical protein
MRSIADFGEHEGAYPRVSWRPKQSMRSIADFGEHEGVYPLVSWRPA